MGIEARDDRYGDICRGISQGRRGSGRLRVRLPVRLVTRTGTHHAVLADLSLKGAQVVASVPLPQGCEVVLEWDRFDAFGEVVWSGGAGAGLQRGEGARCGIAFFDPIDAATLVATRVLDDGARLPREGELVRQVARRWVEGSTRL